ncbi:MAG: GH92 family glycosyl hydrolase, partial [Myxococcota bacterium]
MRAKPTLPSSTASATATLVLGLTACAGCTDDGTGSAAPVRPAQAPLVQWVDPFIGTGGAGFGVGSAFPGPQRPYGMARPGPDTTLAEGAAGFYHCSGYYYDDPLIRGFSQVRPHGMGVPDYGAIGLMPTVGMSEAKTDQQGYRAAFSHDTEEASPGYYAVTVREPDIRVELTATERAGVHRFTFPEDSDAVVLVDVGHFAADVDIIDGSVSVDADAGEVEGFAHLSGGYSNRFGGVPVHFVARFDRPFTSHGTWNAGVLDDTGAPQEGPATGAYLRFDAATDPTVQVAVGLSFVDIAHARLNLNAEVPALDFEVLRAEAEQAWEDALAAVEIEGRSERDFRLFYTALYHVLLMPTRADDVDGSYRGVDGAVHTATDFRYYTDFSLWDTYRTQHPLLTLLYPDYQRDFLRSLTAMARDGGYMPRWPLGIGYTGGMVGESATLVFADSVLKGLGGFDLQAAYDAMRATAMAPTPPDAPYGGRGGIDEYLTLGYVPTEAGGGSVSKTLEYAYDDFALG